MIKDNPYRQPSQALSDPDTSVLICPGPAAADLGDLERAPKKKKSSGLSRESSSGSLAAGAFLPSGSSAVMDSALSADSVPADAAAAGADDEMPDPAVMLSLPRHHDQPTSFDNRIGCLGMVAAALLAAILFL